jgi:DNA-binding NtrC family response regulator
MLTERDLFIDEPPAGSVAVPSGPGLEPGLPLREVERRHILGTLQRTRGNRTEAAKLLGISVRCLQYKLKAYAHPTKEFAETAERSTVVAEAVVSQQRILAG